MTEREVLQKMADEMSDEAIHKLLIFAIVLQNPKESVKTKE